MSLINESERSNVLTLDSDLTETYCQSRHTTLKTMWFQPWFNVLESTLKRYCLNVARPLGQRFVLDLWLKQSTKWRPDKQVYSLGTHVIGYIIWFADQWHNIRTISVPFQGHWNGLTAIMPCPCPSTVVRTQQWTPGSTATIISVSYQTLTCSKRHWGESAGLVPSWLHLRYTVHMGCIVSSWTSVRRLMMVMDITWQNGQAGAMVYMEQKMGVHKVRCTVKFRY